MTVEKELKGTEILIKVAGRIDTVTAPDFEKEISAVFDGKQNLSLDFEQVEYISSTGLRILIAIHKKAQACGGSFVLKNTNDIVSEVLETTGFSEILAIQK